MTSPAEKVASLPPFGVSSKASGGDKRHVVNRKTQLTLCGHVPATIYGVDLRSRRQVTCRRCYRLAFYSPNGYARSTPDVAA